MHEDKPRLSVTKTTDATSVAKGSQIPYTITVTNSGKGDAKNIEIVDALPEGLAYVSSSPDATKVEGNTVTPNPVIAVPMKTSDLGGLDSLLSMVQMPSGVPVACVAINGAKNAALPARRGRPRYRRYPAVLAERIRRLSYTSEEHAISPSISKQPVLRQCWERFFRAP